MLIISAWLSLRFVENQYFKEFCIQLCEIPWACYEIPGRKKSKNLIKNEAQEKKNLS